MWDTGLRGMNRKIFVNYRRGDAPDSTGRLHDRLEQEFSAETVFMDVEGHIKPGDDFIEVIREQVRTCDILLVVIGPRWMELLQKRKEAGDDFVVVEIQTALENGKRLIPVLVLGADMPQAENLPARIRDLARKNAVVLRHDRFRSDCQSLIDAIKKLPMGTDKSAAPTPTLVADRELAYSAPLESAPKKVAKKSRPDDTPATGDIQWYIARDGKQHGPLSEAEMKTFVALNYLRPIDLVWRPGMAEWTLATDIFTEAFLRKSK